MPTRVIWQSNGEGAVVDTPERLLKPGSGQVTLTGPPSCILCNNGKTPGI